MDASNCIQVALPWKFYDLGNWPYDWNWNWNPDLQYLNLSGNLRFEVKPIFDDKFSATSGTMTTSATSPPSFYGNAAVLRKPDEHVAASSPSRQITDFSSLSKIRVLGLMGVMLSVPVPEETPQRRIRVSSMGGASAEWRQQIAGVEDIKVRSI